MRNVKMPAFALATILAGGLQPAKAQTVATSFSLPVPATCNLPKPRRVVTSLRDLPDVLAEFRRQKIDMADVGGKFIPSDVEPKASEGLSHRQFVRAYVFSDRTVVWYYRGGYVSNFHIVELKMQPSDNLKGSPLKLRLTGRTLMGPPCAATEAILAGVDSNQGW